MVSTEQNNVFAFVGRPARSVVSATPSLDFRNSPNIIESYRNTFGDGKSFELSQLPILPRKAYLLSAHKQIKSKVENSLRNISKYEDIIMLAADKYEISPNLLKALLIQESNGIWYARSPVGALGIAQFMPGTWNDVNNEQNKKMNYTNPLNPYQAIHASAQYLRDQLGPCNGNKDAALASYNQGRGMVRQKDNRWRIRDWKGQNVETTETLDYVASIRIIEQYLDDNYPLGEPAQWDNNNGKYSWKATGKDAEKLQQAKKKEPFIDKKNMGGEGRDIDDYLNDQDFIRDNPQFVKNIKNLTSKEIEVIEPAHPEIRERAKALGNTQTGVEISEDQSTKQKQKKFTVSDFGKEVLKRAGMSDEQIAALTDYAELKGDVLKKHNELIKTGISNKEKRINANKEKKKGDSLEPVTEEEQYLRLFPGKRDNTGYSEDDVDIFKWLQEAHSQSNPSNPTKGGPKRSPYSVRKKPITVGIVVPGRTWNQLGPDKEKLKQQIALAWDYLESVGIEAGLDPRVVYSNDPRLDGKVHLMPLNKKNQPMFSHWDKGVSWESGVSTVGGPAVVAGGGALGKVLTPSTKITAGLAKNVYTLSPKTGVLAKIVPKTLDGILIGAAAYGGSTAGNKMFNHDVFGMAREFQLPHALNIGYQELLKDKPSIKFTPKGDSSDILNDPIRVIKNRGAIANYYDENVSPGQSIGFETSAWGYGSKPILSEGTLETIFDLMEKNNKLYTDIGGTDPQTIFEQQQAEKKKIEEQQKIKEKESTQEDIQHQQRIREQEEKDRKKREEENDERLTKMFYAMLKFR